MIDIVVLCFFLIGLAVGLYVGGRRRDEAWSSNARGPMRIFYRGQAYKVQHFAEGEIRDEVRAGHDKIAERIAARGGDHW